MIPKPILLIIAAIIYAAPCFSQAGSRTITRYKCVVRITNNTNKKVIVNGGVNFDQKTMFNNIPCSYRDDADNIRTVDDCFTTGFRCVFSNLVVGPEGYECSTNTQHFWNDAPLTVSDATYSIHYDYYYNTDNLKFNVTNKSASANLTIGADPGEVNTPLRYEPTGPGLQPLSDILYSDKGITLSITLVESGSITYDPNKPVTTPAPGGVSGSPDPYADTNTTIPQSQGVQMINLVKQANDINKPSNNGNPGVNAIPDPKITQNQVKEPAEGTNTDAVDKQKNDDFWNDKVPDPKVTQNQNTEAANGTNTTDQSKALDDFNGNYSNQNGIQITDNSNANISDLINSNNQTQSAILQTSPDQNNDPGNGVSNLNTVPDQSVNNDDDAAAEKMLSQLQSANNDLQNGNFSGAESKLNEIRTEAQTDMQTDQGGNVGSSDNSDSNSLLDPNAPLPPDPIQDTSSSDSSNDSSSDSGDSGDSGDN